MSSRWVTRFVSGVGSVALIVVLAAVGSAVPAQAEVPIVRVMAAEPPTPAPVPLTSTGIGTATQTAAVDLSLIPPGGSVELVDRYGNSADSPYNEYSGAGVFTFDAASGIFTYTPRLGFSGEVYYPAGYRITDADGLSQFATYTPTVTPPPGPTPTPFSSEGPVDVAQTVTLPLAGNSELARLELLDADGNGTRTVEVQGGVYQLIRQTGVLTFTPDAGYIGTPDPVVFQITDDYGTSGSSTYSPVVVGAPEAQVFTSTGVGQAVQTVTVLVPMGGSVTFLAGGLSVSSLDTPGEGHYEVEPASGRITFTPQPGFVGQATSPTIELTDRLGQVAAVTYTATVILPAGPTLAPVTTTGIGVAAQTVTFTPPPGGRTFLLAGEVSVNTLTVPGEGTYTLDPATGIIVFAPDFGFAGNAAPVSILAVDAYGQTGRTTWSALVIAPPAPTAAALTSVGNGSEVQSVTVALPRGGAIALLSRATQVNEVTVAGQGTYTLDPVTGQITFTPLASYSGTADPVTYQVLDAYGSSATATYTPTVRPTAGTPNPTSNVAAPISPQHTAAELAKTGNPIPAFTLAAFVILAAGVGLLLASRRRSA